MMPHEQEMKALADLASRQKMAGELTACLKSRQALEKLHDACDVDARTRTQNLGQIANLCVHLRLLPEAERAARKSHLLSHALADKPRATRISLLACVLAEAGQFDEAVKFGDQAVAIFASVLGADHDFVIDRGRDVQRMREKQTGRYLDF